MEQKWPHQYEPSNCPVHVRNELAMASPPEERIGAWLIRAQLWPTWYPNSANIHFLSGNPPDLALGSKFRWKTFGVTIESTVLEFKPYERLASNPQQPSSKLMHGLFKKPLKAERNNRRGTAWSDCSTGKSVTSKPNGAPTSDLA